MKRLNVKNHQPLVGEVLERTLRLDRISELATSREMLTPVMEYRYCSSADEPVDIKKKHISVKGVIFEPGDPNDAVRLLIRPNVTKQMLGKILLALVRVLRDHERDDWSEELKESLDLAAVQFVLNDTVE